MRIKSGASYRYWFYALLLFSPVIIVYACHYFAAWRAGEIPTGFVHYDMPYYMANAREYSDQGGFSFLYSSPYTDHYDSKAIYFQPHLFVLGMIFKLFHPDPGTLFVLFGLLSGLICIRVLILLFEDIFGLDTKIKWIGLLLFVWGGGVLSIAGFLVSKDRMEAIIETMEILANTAAMKAITDFEDGRSKGKDISCLDE